MTSLVLQASLETIEAEFWKVVEEAEEPVEVLYGADIDTTITGSGFPQKVCSAYYPLPYKCIAWPPHTLSIFIHECLTGLNALRHQRQKKSMPLLQWRRICGANL